MEGSYLTSIASNSKAGLETRSDHRGGGDPRYAVANFFEESQIILLKTYYNARAVRRVMGKTLSDLHRQV